MKRIDARAAIRRDNRIAATDAWLEQARLMSDVGDISNWLIEEFPGPVRRDPRIYYSHHTRLKHIGKKPFSQVQLSLKWEEDMFLANRTEHDLHYFRNGRHSRRFSGFSGTIKFKTFWNIYDVVGMLTHVGIRVSQRLQETGKLQTYNCQMIAEEWPALAVMAVLAKDDADSTVLG